MHGGVHKTVVHKAARDTTVLPVCHNSAGRGEGRPSRSFAIPGEW
jgi:hypothetical protein